MDVLDDPFLKLMVEGLRHFNEILLRNQVSVPSTPAVCKNNFVCYDIFPARLVNHGVKIGINTAFKVEMKFFEDVNL